MSVLQLVQLTDTHIYAEPGQRLRDTDTRASLAAVLAAARARSCSTLTTGLNPLRSGAAALATAAGLLAWRQQRSQSPS